MREEFSPAPDAFTGPQATPVAGEAEGHRTPGNFACASREALRQARESRRRQGMEWLVAGVSTSEVARRLGVSRQTVATWNAAVRERGEPWRSKPLGRPSRLSGPERDTLRRLLDDAPGEGAWSLARIARVIDDRFDVRYSHSNVWYLLRTLDLAHLVDRGRRPQPSPSRS